MVCAIVIKNIENACVKPALGKYGIYLIQGLIQSAKCIALSLVEVALVLSNERNNFLVGVTLKVNASAEDLVVEKPLKVYTLDNFSCFLDSKSVKKSLEVITISVKDSKNLILKSLGELSAISCSLKNSNDLVSAECTIGKLRFYFIQSEERIVLSDVEILLILSYNRSDLLVGISIEILKLVNDFAIKETLEVYVLDNVYKILNCEVVKKSVDILAINSEGGENLALKKLGELTVVSCLTNNLSKLIGDDEVNVDIAAVYIKVNVLIDNLSNCSDIIISATCLNSKNEVDVTKGGVDIKLTRNLHLIVRHLCDLGGSRKEVDRDCSKCFKIKLLVVCISAVENVLIDLNLVDGIEDEECKLHLTHLSKKRVNVNVNISHNLILSRFLVSLIVDRSLKVVEIELDCRVVDYDLKIFDSTVEIILNAEVLLVLINLRLNLFLYLFTNIAVKDSLNAGLINSVVANFLSREFLKLRLEFLSLALNVFLNLLVSKIENRFGNVSIFIAKKPLFIGIDVFLNLAILDLCKNAVIDNVFSIIKNLLSQEHYLFFAEVFDIPCK